jgi:hypothetical protein
MANLDESSIFEDYVYQIELTDYIEGGRDGIHNLPLKQLTNRTRWLYDRMQYITDNYRYILPTASRTVLGGIKVGAGLSIDSDGVLRAVLPTTTTTTTASPTTTITPVTLAPTTRAPTTTTMPVTVAPALDVPRIVSMTRSAPTATGVTITCVASSPSTSNMSRVSNIVVWWNRTDGSIASTNVPYVSGRDSYTFTISNLVPDSSYTIFSSCSDGLVFSGNRVVSAIGVGAQLTVNTLSISTAVTTAAPTTTAAPSGGASTPYAGITRTQLMNAIYALTFFRYCDPTGGPYWLNEMVNTGDLVLVGTDGFDIRNSGAGIEHVVSTMISSVSVNHNELYTMLPVNTIVGGALSSASQYPNRYTPQFVLGTPILSATKFMNAIYKYSLGRLADRAGAMYWIGEMINMGYISVSSNDMMTVNNLNGIESTVRSMVGGVVQAPDVYTGSPISSIVNRALSNYNDGTFFPSVYTL